MSEETRGARTPVRVVIADDHPLFRDGLRKILELEPGFTVVGDAGDGADAVRLVESLDPDVLLLDVGMPRLGGLEALSAIQGARTRVLVLTGGISEGAIMKALQLGARGIVLKETATRDLIDAIWRVAEGKYAVGEGAVESLAEAIRRPAGERDRRYNLTARELDILGAIVNGASNKEIADRLSISVQTVKHHLTNIFDKTGTTSRLELALFAVSQRLTRQE